jgi:hypothetical protein
MIKKHLFLISILFLAVIASCKKEKPEALSPIPLSQIVWGSSSDAIIKAMEKTEWKLTDNKPDHLEFTIHYENEIADTGILKDLPNDPYTATWFLNNGKLAIVQLIRKDSKSNLAEYMKKAEEMYSLKKPSWESEEKIFKNKGENEGRIKESVKIYDGGTHIAKIIYSLIEADLIPEKMKAETKSVFTDRLEIILYSKTENQGLTVEALADPEK